MLHQVDLGIIKIIWSIAQETSSIILPELDTRLEKIKEIGRYHQYRLPCTISGGYLVSNANFVAFEHRLVMQIKLYLHLFVY
jgi:hypothetical protein